MNITIHRPDVGTSSTYTPAQLRALARSNCKGRGRLLSCWISTTEGRVGGVSLIVQYRPRGEDACGYFSVAI